MAGMELSFQMPAGIDGAVRMPTTNAGSVILLHFLMARAIHTRVESPPCLVQSTSRR